MKIQKRSSLPQHKNPLSKKESQTIRRNISRFRDENHARQDDAITASSQARARRDSAPDFVEVLNLEDESGVRS
ncbi:MAG: hypothetical protein ABSA42_21675 [Terracidiphilus sp.]